MSTYSNRLQSALQTYYNVLFSFPPKIVMHDAYIGRRKSLIKPVTRQKTCNYIELFVSSTRDHHARCIYRQIFRE